MKKVLDERGENDPRPTVRLPRAGLPGAVIAGGAIAAALLLFAILDQKRLRPVARTAAAGNAFLPPPRLIIPPEEGAEAAPPAFAPRYSTIVTSTLPPSVPRLPPATLVSPDMPVPTPASNPPAPMPRQSAENGEEAFVLDAPDAEGGGGGGGGDSRAAAPKTASDAPVQATVLRDQTTIMPAGTVIPATLETPIDTARPGLVRAIVSEDARGFDGKRVLVPRGSRLIGEYQSDVRPSQNRVLVTWTRLIRPDGVAIRIGSPAADALGGAGVPGRLNSYFFRRFAGAVLQSALSIGVNLASRPGSGSVVIGSTGTAASTAGQDLIGGNDLHPKVTVRQGAMLNVFVARDLDFAGASYRARDTRR